MLHSIWLTLDPASEHAVAALIASAADRFDCPVFDPHITLLGELDGPLEVSIDLVAKTFANASPTRLGVSGAKCGDTFFTSIILDTPLPKPFTDARSVLATALTPDRNGLFRPHISLAYGLEDDAIKTGYALELRKNNNFEFVTVAGVAVVRSSKTTPIDQWSTVFTFKFAGP